MYNMRVLVRHSVSLGSKRNVDATIISIVTRWHVGELHVYNSICVSLCARTEEMDLPDIYAYKHK